MYLCARLSLFSLAYICISVSVCCYLVFGVSFVLSHRHMYFILHTHWIHSAQMQTHWIEVCIARKRTDSTICHLVSHCVRISFFCFIVVAATITLYEIGNTTDWKMCCNIRNEKFYWVKFCDEQRCAYNQHIVNGARMRCNMAYKTRIFFALIIIKCYLYYWITPSFCSFIWSRRVFWCLQYIVLMLRIDETEMQSFFGLYLLFECFAVWARACLHEEHELCISAK